MRTPVALVFLLATTLSAGSALAQRNHGGGGNGGGFNHGGNGGSGGSGGNGSFPNTFITVASSSAVATSSAAAAAATTTAAGSSSGSGSVDAALIPPFGITAGIKATDGTDNCVGDGGKDIPCTCPPAVDTFANDVQTFVDGGLAFPTSDSVADQLTRLETCIVTLQNFVGGAGSGVGCPAVSTTWKELQAQLQSESK